LGRTLNVSRGLPMPFHMKYRHKPMDVDAVQWDGKIATLVSFFPSGTEVAITAYGDFLVPTPVGIMPCRIGDWVVRGPITDCYPVRDDLFRERFELVSEEGTE
jgi:hypothetical protein